MIRPINTKNPFPYLRLAGSFSNRRDPRRISHFFTSTMYQIWCRDANVT